MIETGKILQQRYMIGKQIGQGGMGAVYVATDTRFGSTVAIKETLLMDDNYRKAIEREARLLNSLKHPALPRVTDHFLEDNGQYLVMEFIPGEDLGHALDRDPKQFKVEQVMDWADQLLDALGYLHSQATPVIHRDIKPQNLKLTPAGKIVLLDFGLAKGNPTEAGNQTAAKSIFGYSRAYASLEQIQGTGTDPRSDLYSLAATLYHLITGLPPEDALTRAMAILNGKPDPLIPADHRRTEVPAGVAGILQRSMALNSEVRPATADQMREMLLRPDDHAVFAKVTEPVTTTTSMDFSAAPTKILPSDMRHGGANLTDAKTAVKPAHLSQETKLKDTVAVRNDNTDASLGGPSRRGLMAALASVVLLVGGGFTIYFFDPAGFHRAQMANVVPDPSLAASEPSQSSPIEPSVTTTANGKAPESTEKPHPPGQETAKQTKPTASDPESMPDDSTDEPDINVGNIRIHKGTVITPDITIDENGTITSRKPTVVPIIPEVPELTQKQMESMTQQQRRNLERVYLMRKKLTAREAQQLDMLRRVKARHDAEPAKPPVPPDQR